MLTFDEHDSRLTRHEVQILRSIKLRMDGGMKVPPKEYREQADRMFQGCAEDGDLEQRGRE